MATYRIAARLLLPIVLVLLAGEQPETGGTPASESLWLAITRLALRSWLFQTPLRLAAPTLAAEWLLQLAHQGRLALLAPPAAADGWWAMQACAHLLAAPLAAWLLHAIVVSLCTRVPAGSVAPLSCWERHAWARAAAKAAALAAEPGVPSGWPRAYAAGSKLRQDSAAQQKAPLRIPGGRGTPAGGIGSGYGHACGWLSLHGWPCLPLPCMRALGVGRRSRSQRSCIDPKQTCRTAALGPLGQLFSWAGSNSGGASATGACAVSVGSPPALAAAPPVAPILGFLAQAPSTSSDDSGHSWADVLAACDVLKPSYGVHNSAAAATSPQAGITHQPAGTIGAPVVHLMVPCMALAAGGTQRAGGGGSSGGNGTGAASTFRKGASRTAGSNYQPAVGGGSQAGAASAYGGGPRADAGSTAAAGARAGTTGPWKLASPFAALQPFGEDAREQQKRGEPSSHAAASPEAAAPVANTPAAAGRPAGTTGPWKLASPFAALPPFDEPAADEAASQLATNSAAADVPNTQAAGRPAAEQAKGTTGPWKLASPFAALPPFDEPAADEAGSQLSTHQPSVDAPDVQAAGQPVQANGTTGPWHLASPFAAMQPPDHAAASGPAAPAAEGTTGPWKLASPFAAMQAAEDVAAEPQPAAVAAQQGPKQAPAAQQAPAAALPGTTGPWKLASPFAAQQEHSDTAPEQDQQPLDASAAGAADAAVDVIDAPARAANPAAPPAQQQGRLGPWKLASPFAAMQPQSEAIAARHQRQQALIDSLRKQRSASPPGSRPPSRASDSSGSVLTMATGGVHPSVPALSAAGTAVTIGSQVGGLGIDSSSSPHSSPLRGSPRTDSPRSGGVARSYSGGASPPQRSPSFRHRPPLPPLLRDQLALARSSSLNSQLSRQLSGYTASYPAASGGASGGALAVPAVADQLQFVPMGGDGESGYGAGGSTTASSSISNDSSGAPAQGGRASQFDMIKEDSGEGSPVSPSGMHDSSTSLDKSVCTDDAGTRLAAPAAQPPSPNAPAAAAAAPAVHAATATAPLLPAAHLVSPFAVNAGVPAAVPAPGVAPFAAGGPAEVGPSAAAAQLAATGGPSGAAAPVAMPAHLATVPEQGAATPPAGGPAVSPFATVAQHDSWPAGSGSLPHGMQHGGSPTAAAAIPGRRGTGASRRSDLNASQISLASMGASSTASAGAPAGAPSYATSVPSSASALQATQQPTPHWQSAPAPAAAVMQAAGPAMAAAGGAFGPQAVVSTPVVAAGRVVQQAPVVPAVYGPVQLLLPLGVLAVHPPVLTENQPTEVKVFVSGLEQLLGFGAACASYRLVAFQGSLAVGDVRQPANQSCVRLALPALHKGVVQLALLINGDTQVAMVQPLVVVPVPCAAEVTMLWNSLVMARLQATGLHAALPTGMMPSGAVQLQPGPVMPGAVMPPWRMQLNLHGRAAVLPVMPDQVAAAWQQQYQPILTDMAFLLAAHFQHAMALSGNTGALPQGLAAAGLGGAMATVADMPVSAAAGLLGPVDAPEVKGLVMHMVEFLAMNGLWACLQFITDSLYGAGASAKALYSAKMSRGQSASSVASQAGYGGRGSADVATARREPSGQSTQSAQSRGSADAAGAGRAHHNVRMAPHHADAFQAAVSTAVSLASQGAMAPVRVSSADAALAQSPVGTPSGPADIRRQAPASAPPSGLGSRSHSAGSGGAGLPLASPGEQAAATPAGPRPTPSRAGSLGSEPPSSTDVSRSHGGALAVADRSSSDEIGTTLAGGSAAGAAGSAAAKSGMPSARHQPPQQLQQAPDVNAALQLALQALWRALAAKVSAAVEQLVSPVVAVAILGIAAVVAAYMLGRSVDG